MSANAIAKRYAKALVQLGTEEKAKITHAQTRTGSQTVSADRLGVATCVDIAES